jgi:hypothetical protein
MTVLCPNSDPRHIVSPDFNRTCWFDSFLPNIGSGGPVNFAR